jgi:hypothetical protein
MPETEAFHLAPPTEENLTVAEARVYTMLASRVPRKRFSAAISRCETVIVCGTNVLGQMHQFAMMGGRSEHLAELELDQLIAVLSRPNRRASRAA